MRLKESENDYRYFPDPDLIPMQFDEATIADLRASLPELPLAKLRRYQDSLGLSQYDASVLVADRDWANYFEACVQLGGDPKGVCNWMNSEFARLLNESGQAAAESKVTPAHIVDLLRILAEGQINGKMAKTIFADSFESGKLPSELAAGGGQITDEDAVREIVRGVLAANPAIVEKFRGGNEGVKGFLVGQVMKQSEGRANPQLAQKLVLEELAV